MIGETLYDQAARAREIDRQRCTWPEVAIVGVGDGAASLAATCRRAGIVTATYLSVVRRQYARAIKDGADFLVFADRFEMREVVEGSQWRLDPADPLTGIMFACVCAYLPQHCEIVA